MTTNMTTTGDIHWQVFADGNFQLSENPLWDHQLNGLWWLDIPGKSVHFQAFNQEPTVWKLDEQPGALWIDGDRVWIAARQHIYSLDRAVNLTIVQPVLQFKSPFDGKNQRFNDVASSADLTLIGSLIDDKSTPSASIYAWTNQSKNQSTAPVTTVFTGLTTANGLGIIDSNNVIIADTASRHIGWYQRSHEPTYQCRQVIWQQPQSIARPDGLLIHQQQLYFAMFEGAHILRLSMDFNDLKNISDSNNTEIPAITSSKQSVPILCPTKLCLGGQQQEWVFLTSAGCVRPIAERQQYPLSGKVLYAPSELFLNAF